MSRLSNCFVNKPHQSTLINCRGAVAQSVEHPSKVPFWRISTDWREFESRRHGIRWMEQKLWRISPSHAIWRTEISARNGKKIIYEFVELTFKTWPVTISFGFRPRKLWPYEPFFSILAIGGWPKLVPGTGSHLVQEQSIQSSLTRTPSSKLF